MTCQQKQILSVCCRIWRKPWWFNPATQIYILSSKSHAEFGAETDWKKQPVLQTVLMSKRSISASKWLCEAASKEPSTPRNLGDPKTLVVCEPASTRSVSLSTSPHISSPMHCKSRLNLMAGKMLIHDASTIVHHSSYSRSTPGSKR